MKKRLGPVYTYTLFKITVVVNFVLTCIYSLIEHHDITYIGSLTLVDFQSYCVPRDREISIHYNQL